MSLSTKGEKNEKNEIVVCRVGFFKSPIIVFS